MKPFAAIRESIARTDPVVKLLQGEGIQNRIVRVVLQIVPLLAAVFIPILISQYDYRLTGINFILFATSDTINYIAHNFFRLCICAGLLHFFALPTIASVITSLLAARFVQAADYELVRLTALDSAHRVLGILRAALGRNKILVITSVGLLILMLLGTFEEGSFAGIFQIQISPAWAMVIAAFLFYDPLPQVCLIFSLIGITILCATIGIAVSAKFSRAIPSYTVAGVVSAIITLLLWLVYKALIDCTYDIGLHLGSNLMCHTNKNLLLQMAIISFGLAYTVFQLAERWV